MIKYILKRILYLIPVMLLVTLIVFFLMSITKGDPARIVVGESASLEEVEAMRESMGLNDPFFIRYLRYVRDLFLHGNMGTSYKSGLPVMKEIMSALPSTIRLSLAAITIAILIGIPIGIISATKQYSFFDNFTMILGLIGISMPVFWLGLLLILLFSVRLGWFPPSGLTSFRHVVLPAFTLGSWRSSARIIFVPCGPRDRRRLVLRSITCSGMPLFPSSRWSASSSAISWAARCSARRFSPSTASAA